MYFSETLTQAELTYIGRHKFGGIIVFNNSNKTYEHYVHAPNFAGHTIRYKGHKYEFVSNSFRNELKKTGDEVLVKINSIIDDI